MPFSIEIEGMDELIIKMGKIPEKAAKAAAEALYEGAGVVADSVSRAVQGIATEPFKYAKNGKTRKPSPEEKAVLVNAKHGVAKFRKSGLDIQTSVGFQNTGYAAIAWNHAKTSASRTKYKDSGNGRMVHASKGTGRSMKPVPVIANSINSGTSFMEKQPFLRKAFSKSRQEATAVIERELESRLEEISLD